MEEMFVCYVLLNEDQGRIHGSLRLAHLDCTLMSLCWQCDSRNTWHFVNLCRSVLKDYIFLSLFSLSLCSLVSSSVSGPCSRSQLLLRVRQHQPLHSHELRGQTEVFATPSNQNCSAPNWYVSAAAWNYVIKIQRSLSRPLSYSKHFELWTSTRLDEQF